MYELEFKPSFVRALEGLTARDANLRNRLWNAVQRLKADPRPSGAKKLVDARSEDGDLWRIRVGDYRIVYAIKDRQLLILLVALGDRKDIYK